MSTAAVSATLGMLPVFGVLYWFGVQNDSWKIVVVVHIVYVVACVITLARQLTVYSAVSKTELSGRGIFSPMEHVALDTIASVTLVPTYIGQAPEPVVQLLVRDGAGRRLFRMRGNFWHSGDLDAIADALPVEATVVKEPMRVQDFYRDYPGSAYWFENNRVVSVALVFATMGTVAALTALILAVFH